MDKRKAAREARIKNVLDHKDVVDIKDEIAYLQKIADGVNIIYKLNVEFAFAKMDTTKLLASGWKKCGTVEDNPDYRAIYYANSTFSGKKHFRIALSPENEWLALIEGDEFKECDWSAKLPKKTADALEKSLRDAVSEPPEQDYDKFSMHIRRISPPLFTSVGKAIDPFKESLISIFERTVNKWHNNGATDYAYAAIFHLLRFVGTPNPKLAWYAMYLNGNGERCAVEAWSATACLLLLRYKPDGCICTHYYSIINYLMSAGCYLSAFYCENISFLYNLPNYVTVTVGKTEDYMFCARRAVAELVLMTRTEEIPSVIDAVEYFLSFHPSDICLAEMQYLRSLMAIGKKDNREAKARFEKALELFGDAKDKSSRNYIAAIKSCMKCKGVRKGVNDDCLNLDLLKYLDYYPHVPCETLTKNNKLPNFFYYAGHGHHWKSVFGVDVTEESMEPVVCCFKEMKRFVKDAISYPYGMIDRCMHVNYLPTIASNDATVFIYEQCDVNYDSSVLNRKILSFFPTVMPDEANTVVSRLSDFRYDASYGDATAELSIEHGPLCFYLVPGETEFSLRHGDYRISLCALGYSLAKFKPFSFKADLPTNDGTTTKETLHVSNDLRCMTNTPFGYDDEVEFVAKAVSVERFRFLDNDMLKVVLEFDERVLNLHLPLLINVNLAENGYIPQVGDIIHGTAWLQGTVVGRG